jgi:hypothetical protein
MLRPDGERVRRSEDDAQSPLGFSRVSLRTEHLQTLTLRSLSVRCMSTRCFAQTGGFSIGFLSL